MSTVMTGTSQLTRAIPALHSEAAPPDSRTARQLIANVVERASLYRFFDSKNRPAGDWSVAYAQVPLVRYARLAELDFRTEREWTAAALKTLGEANDGEPGISEVGCRLVEWLMGWFLRLEEERVAFSAWPHEQAFVVGLENLIADRLAPSWHDLGRSRVEIFRCWPISPDADASRALYRWPTPTARVWEEREAAPSSVIKSRAALNRDLGTIVATLFSTLLLVISEAQRLFAERYEHPAELPPQVGLYTAFVRAFMPAQALLNDLPRRHRDYYFRKILKAQPRGVRPDRVFVSFSAATLKSFALLPTGTELLAGKDAAGAPIYFRTDLPVQISGSIRMVHADREVSTSKTTDIE